LGVSFPQVKVDLGGPGPGLPWCAWSVPSTWPWHALGVPSAHPSLRARREGYYRWRPRRRPSLAARCLCNAQGENPLTVRSPRALAITPPLPQEAWLRTPCWWQYALHAPPLRPARPPATERMGGRGSRAAQLSQSPPRQAVRKTNHGPSLCPGPCRGCARLVGGNMPCTHRPCAPPNPLQVQ